MIPRVVYSDRTRRIGRRCVSAFERGRDERSFRLFVDGESMGDDLARTILLGFSGHPLVDVMTTIPTFDPHLEVEPSQSDGTYPSDLARVTTVGSKLQAWGAVHYASQKRRVAEKYLRGGESLVGATEKAILADYVELEGADALVSSSPTLQAMVSDGFYRGANVMQPSDAVALVGLFLRLRHDFAYLHSGTSSASYGKRGFYAILARDLLPAAGRWLGTCPDADGLRSSPYKLAATVLVRLERALYARDRIHEQFLVPQRAHDGEDALFYLDAFLYSLAGAFDAVARVAHIATGMNGKVTRANWRAKSGKKDSWIDELSKLAPALAATMGEATPNRDVLDLIVLLRNSVHGAGLSAVDVINNPARLDELEHRLLLPPEDNRLLLDAINRLGLAAWEVEQIDADAYVVTTTTFVERILPLALAALETLMTRTPVELLAAGGGSQHPLLDERAAAAAPRIRLLSGLA